MKPRLIDLIACPIDRLPLELLAWERNGDEIVTGLLLNRRRRVAYPIHRAIPRLLTFPTAVSREFWRQHRERLARELPDFAPPSEAAAPGEEDVLRSFSTEWQAYEWDGRAYWNLEPEAWFACMRFLLDLENRPVRGGRVLEVGIGIGGVADWMARTEADEVVGMDLGHAVDSAHHYFGSNPRLHLVQASVFATPFRDATFDFVYSFGVIHHTFSTRTAFARLATLPKPGGRLNVWVYSPGDEERTPTRRLLMLMERAIRPWMWRLPARAQSVALLPLVPLYMGFQAVRARREGKGQVGYGWREAVHAARDRFTPRYIHRHTDEELCQWFREAGYERLLRASQRERPDHVPVAFTACTGVDGVRRAAGSAGG